MFKLSVSICLKYVDVVYFPCNAANREQQKKSEKNKKQIAILPPIHNMCTFVQALLIRKLKRYLQVKKEKKKEKKD